MDGCGACFPFAGSDDFGFCCGQPLRMAGLFARIGETRPEDEHSDCPLHDCRLHHRLALWTQRCSDRLLNNHDAVGASSNCMVCTRHSDFLPGCPPDCEPPVGYKHGGGRARIRSTVRLWPAVASFTPVRAGEFRTSSCVPCDAPARPGSEITLPGPSSRIETPFISQREKLGFGLEMNMKVGSLATENPHVTGTNPPNDRVPFSSLPKCMPDTIWGRMSRSRVF